MRQMALSVPQPLLAWREYLELCKPKVVALMMLTAVVGMLLATPGMVPLNALIFGNLGIATSAASAAVINHFVDRRIDAIMRRTQKRPIASGKVTTQNAIAFAIMLAIFSMTVLVVFVNLLTAILTLFTLIGYAFIYTMYLKRATPQNIVIGGLAGAAPPLLGWAAVTGTVTPQALLLVLIIYAWTPPHFWALAIYRHEDYAKANIPMLPVTHGIAFTKLCIMLYTLLLVAVTLMPFVINMSGFVYLVGALALGSRYCFWSYKLLKTSQPIIAMKSFRFSISYLMLLFALLLIDHYLMAFQLI